jgi:hypothetical protein
MQYTILIQSLRLLLLSLLLLSLLLLLLLPLLSLLLLLPLVLSREAHPLVLRVSESNTV